jgi:putative flavoprotein involved in K+ transport
MPGVYALGMRFLRKRDSNFIGGAGTDAIALSRHIAGYLNRTALRAA